jgi:hypothetical protein
MYTDHMIRARAETNFLQTWTGSSLVSRMSDAIWKAFQAINGRLPEGELPTPKWAPGKMLKSRERSAPPLQFPRITGVGWRQIIENMHKTATVAEWHKQIGRHEIFAKGKRVQLQTGKHTLDLPVIQPNESGCHDNPGFLERDKQVLAASREGR